MGIMGKNIKKNNSRKLSKLKKSSSGKKNLRKLSKLKRFSKRNKRGGNSCTVKNTPPPNYGCNTSGMSTCIPNVNVEQYKFPCNFLPLDGTKQNIYPLSHNPKPGTPFGLTTGGKKTMRRNKKGGNTYLSVNNDTNAYTRYGAPGNCSGPNWKYASVKGGKNKRSTKMLRKSRTRLKGGNLCSLSPSQQKNCLRNSKLDIGTRVSVLWTNYGQEKRYEGVIEEYNYRNGKHRVKYDDGDVKEYVMADKNFDVISYGSAELKKFKEAEQNWLKKQENLTKARERVDNLKKMIPGPPRSTPEPQMGGAGNDHNEASEPPQLTEEQRVNQKLQEARNLADETLHPKDTYVAKYDDYRILGAILNDVKKNFLTEVPGFKLAYNPREATDQILKNLGIKTTRNLKEDI